MYNFSTFSESKERYMNTFPERRTIDIVFPTEKLNAQTFTNICPYDPDITPGTRAYVRRGGIVLGHVVCVAARTKQLIYFNNMMTQLEANMWLPEYIIDIRQKFNDGKEIDSRKQFTVAVFSWIKRL